MLKNMKIGLRIGLSFGVVLALIIGMGLFALSSLGTMPSGTMIIGFLGGSFALAMLMIFLVTRSITKPLSEAAAISKRLAEGDLSVVVGVGRGDEVGQLLSA